MLGRTLQQGLTFGYIRNPVSQPIRRLVSEAGRRIIPGLAGESIAQAIKNSGIRNNRGRRRGLEGKSEEVLRRSFEGYPEVLQSSHQPWQTIPFLRLPDDRSTLKTGRAGNLAELLQRSLTGHEVTYIEGPLLNKIRRDPATIAVEKDIMRQVQERRNDPNYDGQPFVVTNLDDPITRDEDGKAINPRQIQLGGDRGPSYLHPRTLEAGRNELTWTHRHAGLRYWAEVDAQGQVNIEYRVHDTLDLTPQSSRNPAYNLYSVALGGVYHGIAGGNENMQTRAEWTSTRQA